MTEIIIVVGILILSLILIRVNFLSAVILALVLSTFLHKELFSLYIWDLLPIRVLMGAFLLNSLYEFFKFNKLTLKFLPYLKDPFILINLLIIGSRIISMVNTLNLRASINLNLFFVAATVFVITIYIKLKSSEILDLYKKYINISVILSLITFVQLYFYFQYSFLFGAILNIAGNSVDFPAFSLSYDFFTNALKVVVMTRVGSLFWDVNHFGGYIAALVTPLIAFIMITNFKTERLGFKIFSLLIILTTLFLTNSRSAWVLAFVSLFVYFSIVIYTKLGSKGVYYSLAILSFAAIVMTGMYLDKNSLFREKVRSYFHYRLDSFDSHFLLLQGTVDVFHKFPLIGGGSSSFFEHFKSTPTSNEFLRRDPAGLSVRVPAHSIWGEYLSETGLLGTSFFILFVLFNLSVYLYTMSLSKGTKNFYLLTSFFATFLGWLVCGIFYSYNSEFFYILVMFPLIFALKEYKVNLSEILLFVKNRSYLSLILILGLGIGMIFYGLGNNKLIPFDEAIYAKVAKNILTTNDYLSLTWMLGEKFWFEKPPLYFIITAFLYDILGVTEFTSRFFTALMSVVCLIFTYKIAKIISGSRSGFYAILALILNTSYLYYSRTAMLDIILTSFITVSIYYYLKFLTTPKNINLYLSGLFIGLAVLTKSVVGFLPLGFIFVHQIYLWFLKEIQLKNFFISFIKIFGTSLLVSLPWHIYMVILHGNLFIDSYFGYHLLQRFSSEIEDKGGPWDYYITVIRNSMRVWYLILLPSLGYLFYKLWKNKKDKNLSLLIISSVVTLLFFSVSSSKLRWYIMPIYPFLSIICGMFISYLYEILEKRYKNLTLNFIAVFAFVIFNFAYFYTIRGMVYTGDLNGKPVSLILRANDVPKKEFDFIYLDKVDYPTANFYSEKPFEIVDYQTLRVKLNDIKNSGGKVLFITGESRFRNIKDVIPEVQFIDGNNDFTLGSIAF